MQYQKWILFSIFWFNPILPVLKLLPSCFTNLKFFTTLHVTLKQPLNMVHIRNQPWEPHNILHVHVHIFYCLLAYFFPPVDTKYFFGQER